jgi:hypothetical protein
MGGSLTLLDNATDAHASGACFALRLPAAHLEQDSAP